jgi:hypothetical protein
MKNKAGNQLPLEKLKDNTLTTTIYNLIRIHIHHLFISSSYVLHFESFKILWELYSSSKNYLWNEKKKEYW